MKFGGYFFFPFTVNATVQILSALTSTSKNMLVWLFQVYAYQQAEITGLHQ